MESIGLGARCKVAQVVLANGGKRCDHSQDKDYESYPPLLKSLHQYHQDRRKISFESADSLESGYSLNVGHPGAFASAIRHH